MKDIIKGKAYVLGDDIDTDAIIPAEYLYLSHTNPDQKKEIAKYTFSGLPDHFTPFVPEGKDATPYKIVVAGKNFGCGSSRAQAPGCLNAAGVEVVLAEYYARIFFRNSVNAGLLLLLELFDEIYTQIDTGDELEILIKEHKVINHSKGKEYSIKPIGAVKDILEAGSVFDYAKKKFACLNESK